MLYLDYLSYHNRFVHISILEKLAVGLGGLLLAVSSGTPVMNLAVFLFMSAILWRAGMNFGYWLRLWGTLLPFLLTAVLTILFSFAWQPFDALWQMQLGPFYVGITAAGRQGAQRHLIAETEDRRWRRQAVQQRHGKVRDGRDLSVLTV